MRYYTLPAIGTGTTADPVRPPVPAGTSWAGSRAADGSFLIATPAALAGIPGLVQLLTDAELGAACAARGLDVAAVRSWRVGPP